MELCSTYIGSYGIDPSVLYQALYPELHYKHYYLALHSGVPDLPDVDPEEIIDSDAFRHFLVYEA